MTVRDEIFKIQRELKLNDVTLCNYLGILTEELESLKRDDGKFVLGHLNLMMFIMSTRRPLNSLL